MNITNHTTNPTTMNTEQQPENLAAIIAEMKRENRPYGISIERLHYYADRIEAAAKQEAIDAELKWTRIGYDERKAEEKRAHGNAAAMRAVLHDVDAYLGNIIPTRRENELRKAARAALAAPARNCDRFQTEEEAYAAFMGLFDHFKGERHYQYCRWLFAPAEGGAE